MYNYQFGSIQEEKKKFWVVSVISNPVRFKSRYALYKKFFDKLKAHDVNHLTVELAYGNRPFELFDMGQTLVQLRTDQELWHKENMINVGISRLPSDWKYVAWIDADISFTRDDIIEETIHQLQHYQVVQMWQNAIDLGPKDEIVQTHNGFMAAYLNGLPYKKQYYFWHPGFAWAARREAIDNLGGLFDSAILGAGDHHMALALIGRVRESYPGNINSNYKALLHDWENRATKYIKKDVGYVPGTLLHYWHGKKKDRKYIERWDILTKNNYDPLVDIKRDWQGIYQLDSDSIKLRDDIRAYFRNRNEDSSDLE